VNSAGVRYLSTIVCERNRCHPSECSLENETLSRARAHARGRTPGESRVHQSVGPITRESADYWRLYASPSTATFRIECNGHSLSSMRLSFPPPFSLSSSFSLFPSPFPRRMIMRRLPRFRTFRERERERARKGETHRERGLITREVNYGRKLRGLFDYPIALRVADIRWPRYRPHARSPTFDRAIARREKRFLEPARINVMERRAENRAENARGRVL